MREIVWIDSAGKKHKSLIRDDDEPSVAYDGGGIPQDPPDIEQIDFEQVKVILHNQLLDRKLLTQEDVNEQQNGITGAVLRALRPFVLELYR
jgi:hypothetical protein